VNSEEDRRKNAADIELSLDALELVYTRLDIDYYCLVCGGSKRDGAFCFMGERLKQGKTMGTVIFVFAL